MMSSEWTLDVLRAMLFILDGMAAVAESRTKLSHSDLYTTAVGTCMFPRGSGVAVSDHDTVGAAARCCTYTLYAASRSPIS